MTNINERDYNDMDLSKAVAFALRFRSPMIYGYDNTCPADFQNLVCSKCNRWVQEKDYLIPKASAKNKLCGYLDLWEYAVNHEVRNLLIENFDITEDDFRPVRTKAGEIVMWQITPKHVMKPIAEVNRVRKFKPCKCCGSIKHEMKDYENSKGWEYYYITQEALDDMHDMNITCETYTMHYYQMEFVSRRVYDFLMERYPRMMFAPVFLKEPE